MKLKPVQHKHLFRLTSFMCLLACLTLQNVAMADAVNTGKPGTITATPDTKKQKPVTSFQQVENFPALLESGELKMSDIANPHWNKNGCIACHKSTKANASAKNLRHKAIEKTCHNCHSPTFDHRYVHPVNVRIDKKMLQRMDKSMRSTMAKSKNTIICTTCHDLKLQCLPGFKKQKFTNPKFFRKGPHENRSQLCFLCHDRNQYQRLDPHDQIDKQGKLRPEKCRVCHADSIERLNHITDTDQLQFNAKKSLSTMCWGCHPWIPHPGGQFTFFKKKSGPDHLVKPSKEIQQRLDKMTRENHVAFPLEPETGKVFCATCHNVHEKGVIKNPEKAKGADSKKRLRVQKICSYCHLK